MRRAPNAAEGCGGEVRMVEGEACEVRVDLQATASYFGSGEGEGARG